MAKAKRIKGIDCDDHASAGIRLVLQTRFEEMYGFHRAALDFSDPEGVHSMRVASRRLRSVLRDFMPYLSQSDITDVVKKTKNIAGALGQVRDQDVAIIALEEIQKQAPAAVSVAFKKLIEERKERRNEARKKLKAILVTKQMKQTKSEFMSRIEEATTRSGQAEPAPTFSKMATAVILDRLKELEELSDSLYKPFDVEPLHDMRIAAKRLRYALELFQECWGRSLQTYAKSVARMQTALGEVHDCDVWIESLGKSIDRAREKKQDDHVSALIWLLSHFVKVRTKHLLQAYDLWRKWELNDLSGRVRQAVQ